MFFGSGFSGGRVYMHRDNHGRATYRRAASSHHQNDVSRSHDLPQPTSQDTPLIQNHAHLSLMGGHLWYYLGSDGSNWEIFEET